RSDGLAVTAISEGDESVALAERCEPEIDPGAKDRDRRHAERTGDVHGPAVIADEQPAALDERHQLAQSDFGRDDSRHLGQGRAISLRIYEREDASSVSSGQASCNFTEAIERPALLGDACTRMHTDEQRSWRDTADTQEIIGPTSLDFRDLEPRCLDRLWSAESRQQPQPVGGLVAVGVSDGNGVGKDTITATECVGDST